MQDLEGEHEANAIRLPCDLCGEISELKEGICEECLENMLNSKDDLEVV